LADQRLEKIVSQTRQLRGRILPKRVEKGLAEIERVADFWQPGRI
jgi:hypothetical protein